EVERFSPACSASCTTLIITRATPTPTTTPAAGTATPVVAGPAMSATPDTTPSSSPGTSPAPSAAPGTQDTRDYWKWLLFPLTALAVLGALALLAAKLFSGMKGHYSWTLSDTNLPPDTGSTSTGDVLKREGSAAVVY